jgi:Leucine-rich repeat (LRR) protein
LILIDLQAKDVRPIENLTQLETLSLSAYATSQLDLSRLPRLRKAFIEWRRQYRNLSNCVDLADLYLNRYTEPSLSAVEPMQNMHSLRVGGSSTLSSLEGIRGLPRLGVLGLYGLPKLRELDPIADLAGTLEEVDLEQCRYLTSIDPLSRLARLKRLAMVDCGKIPSLRPLMNCRALEELFFSGDTYLIDGDLEFLRNLPLKNVAFQNRKHYTLRNEELSGWHP